MGTLTEEKPFLRFAVTSQRPSLSSQLRRNALARNKAAILRLARESGISNIKLFGSVGRGNAGPESDIDLLITMKEPSLLHLTHFQNEVSRLVGYDIDAVPEDHLKPHVAATINPSEVFTL